MACLAAVEAEVALTSPVVFLVGEAGAIVIPRGSIVSRMASLLEVAPVSRPGIGGLAESKAVLVVSAVGDALAWATGLPLIFF